MEYVLLVITVEAITELLVKSEFFESLRKWLFENNNKKIFKFIHDLLDCGYCTSVWVAIFVVIMYFSLWCIFKYICFILCIHRLSNFFHFIMDRMWDRKNKF